jgi:hypothetical protein
VKHFKEPRQLDFRREVAVMILAGEEDGRMKDSAAKMYNQLERARRLYPAMPAGQKLDLYVGYFKTKMQGTRLLREPALRLDEQIGAFIRKHLAGRAMPHEQRRVR